MDNPGIQNNRISPCPERNPLFCICGNVLVFLYRCSNSRHTAFYDNNVYSKPDNSFRRGQTWPYQHFPLAFSSSGLPVPTFDATILLQFLKCGNSQFPSRTSYCSNYARRVESRSERRLESRMTVRQESPGRGSTAIKTTSKLAVPSAPREAGIWWPLERILKYMITSLGMFRVPPCFLFHICKTSAKKTKKEHSRPFGLNVLFYLLHFFKPS